MSCYVTVRGRAQMNGHHKVSASHDTDGVGSYSSWLLSHKKVVYEIDQRITKLRPVCGNYNISVMLRFMQPFYSNQDMDKAEVYKPPREHSIFSFFDSVVDTNVMREAHKFLAGQGFSPMDTESFKKQLSTFWFDLYSRCEASGNSGFENVSGGGVQDSDVIRFGNWYRFCQPQKQGRVDYKLWSQKQAVSCCVHNNFEKKESQ
ncbi:hypothetical protein NECAME_11172 [Necator americanus]|uniref:EndoU domain-containing protein n=1 Tax=Necator americanus TaxID=51031 RepID=W2T7Z2_NECAM|nr:hypothetical protein NECAME_11172 [Necator americanus]ETN77261.1 hypothetical protein NECAME_11172 [Necator americanus]